MWLATFRKRTNNARQERNHLPHHRPGAVIRNEYGETVAPQDMEANITQRSHPSGTLLSHDIGPYCIGHGDGPFDYMIGEFS